MGKCDTVLCVWKLLHWPFSHSTQHSFHSWDLELLWARKHVLCLLAKPLLYTYFLVAKSNEHSTVLINNPSTVFVVTQHSILTLSFLCFYNINVFCFFSSFLASASVCPFLTLLSLEVLYCFLFIYLFIYLFNFLAALGLCCCTRASSSCGEWGLLFIAVRGLLIAVASHVAEHGL